MLKSDPEAFLTIDLSPREVSALSVPLGCFGDNAAFLNAHIAFLCIINLNLARKGGVEWLCLGCCPWCWHLDLLEGVGTKVGLGSNSPQSVGAHHFQYLRVSE